MLTETDELAELFKGYFPYYILVFIPLFIIISPVSPVSASHEFPAYRMTEYDLNGVSHGCRASLINLEARALRHNVTPRHCVVTRLSSLNAAELARIKQTAGGLLVVMPAHSLTQEEKEAAREVETYLLEDEITIPVYFTLWSSDFEAVLVDIESWEVGDDKTSSSLDAIVNAVTANGYQVVVGAHKPSAKSDAVITSIQGKLSGYGVEDKLPTIAIVTHYDSFGIAPEMPSSTDGNASGVIVFLELIRIFSNLYASSRTHAAVNILFLLSGGGKFNYQGSKKWLEDQLDGLEGSLLQDAAFVLCLDSIGQSKDMSLHVSKPPKESTSAYDFYQELRVASNDSVTLFHKKINLAEELFAWEHERYSMRRLPAFTLSSYRVFRDPGRRSSFGTSPPDAASVVKVADMVASAISSFIYNSPAARDLPLASDPDLVRSWMDLLTSVPRSSILLSDKNNPLVKLLNSYVSRYLKQTKYSVAMADKRDPEFLFYDTTKSTVNLYNVKPAIFDLFISIVIMLYLVVFYLAIQQFDLVYYLVSPRSDKKIKHH